MDWKLLLIGALMAVVGALIVFRFRKSNFNRELGPGCLVAGGLLLLLTGVLSAVLSFLVKV
ncbi:MAG: hypothetical protein IPO30_11795 [Hyphomonadaceae bacterium]|nr:hypothetical protein [Hyphomonadaceae bacterium]